jgi:hypothetical protein
VPKIVPTNSRTPVRIPKAIQFFLNDPPLWRGESRDEYMALLAAIAASCGVRDDVIKWLLVNEIAHQLWEIRRFRKIEAGIVLKHEADVIEEILKTTYAAESDGMGIVFLARNYAHVWTEGPKGRKRVEEILAKHGYDTESIRVKAYQRCAPELREIEIAITKRENRRRATLLEVERRNEAFARRLAQSSMEILDAEFSEAAE